MPSLRELTDSLIAIWTESTPAARAGLIVMLVLCTTMLVYVGIWSSQPTFTTLVSNEDPDRITMIINELEKQGIRYELGSAGSVISVDQQQYSRAKIIAKKNGATAQAESASDMSSIMWDPDKQHNFSVSELRRSIETSIEKLEQVRDATVLLNKPRRRAFERSVVNSASVNLQLEIGAHINKENVFAIASMVANAVNNLEISNVNITDTTGKVYPVSGFDTNFIGEHIEYISNKENELVAKALTQLNKLFGPGNSDVQITLKYDFSTRKVETEEFDKNKVVFEEMITTTESKGGSPLPLGNAGVDSNLSVDSSGGVVSNSSESTQEIIDSKAHVPFTKENTFNNTAKQTAITVAVVVNDQADGIRLEDGNIKPEIKQTIEDLVKNAVGFDEEIGTITVGLIPFFQAPEIEEAAAPFDWSFVNDIIQNASLAVAAIVVLILGMMTLRHFKPTPTTAPTPVASDQSGHIQQLNDLASTNPELFQRILQSWAGEKSPTQETTKRTAA